MKSLPNEINSEYQMTDLAKWDWNESVKSIEIPAFHRAEEPHVSPDGEQLSIVVKNEDDQFQLCNLKVDGTGTGLADRNFERIWFTRFSPDGRLTALVCDDDEWTVSVDGVCWEEKFEYIFNTIFSNDGSSIAAAAAQDSRYAMILNDVQWAQMYPCMTDMVISPSGDSTAAVVQADELESGDIFTYQKGVFTAAVNGKPWEQKFVSVWTPRFCAKGEKLAAVVRQNLDDYTIAVDGKPWTNTFSCAWEPLFVGDCVIAPVKISGKWGLAQDNEIIWNPQFTQLWHQMASDDGKKIAAIVATKFGRWTVAENNKPWKIDFNQMVTDTVISPDANKIAAAVKTNNRWSVALNSVVWNHNFDMVHHPVFGPRSEHLATKVQNNGKYAIYVNDIPLQSNCDAVWDPIFSPDGDKILIRSIEGGKYIRRVVPVAGLRLGR